MTFQRLPLFAIVSLIALTTSHCVFPELEAEKSVSGDGDGDSASTTGGTGTGGTGTGGTGTGGTGTGGTGTGGTGTGGTGTGGTGTGGTGTGGTGTGGTGTGGTGTGGTGTGGTGTGGTGTGGTGTEEPPFGHPDPAATYPVHAGFTLWLVEEFDQPLNLETDPIWTWSDGGLGEGQVRFVKEGIKFENGKMILEAAEDGGAYSYQACSHAEVGNVNLKNLTSGEIRTRHNMFRYGRYEVRMKAPSPVAADPNVNGNYIATLFTFRTPKTVEWREIDIEVTGDGPNDLTTNVIYGDNQLAWSPEIADAGSTVFAGDNARTAFHDYAFEWLPDSITFYVDGQVVRTYTTADKLPIPELSAKIMMNLWIFNGSAGFGGPEIANNTYPMTTEYEWFRFYKADVETTYPCDGFSTSCLTAADTRLGSSNNPCDDIPSGATCTTTCGL